MNCLAFVGLLSKKRRVREKGEELLWSWRRLGHRAQREVRERIDAFSCDGA